MPHPVVLLASAAAGTLLTFAIYPRGDVDSPFWLILLALAAAYAVVGVVTGALGARRVMARRRSGGLEPRLRVDAGTIGAAIVLPIPFVTAWIEQYAFMGFFASALFLPLLWAAAAAGAWTGGKIRVAVSDTMGRVDESARSKQ